MEHYTYNYRIGYSVEKYDITGGGAYGSHWGLTDLYPKCEKNLKSLLTSGEDFCAEWGSKNELLSATILRVDGKLRVSVCAWMDDLWESDDLIYDAYWEATGQEDTMPDYVIDEIRDQANEVGCDDHASAMWEGDLLPYEALMQTIDHLSFDAKEECDKWYRALVQIVSDRVAIGWEEIAE
jgi:hypothetical protein